MNIFSKSLFVVVFLISLAACGGGGGGGGGGSTMPPPTDDNVPPVADAGKDVMVGENASVTLSAQGSSDADGDSLSYAWAQKSGPSVTLSKTTSTTPSFTAPDVNNDAALVFEVAVTDGKATVKDSVTITVNAAPVTNAGKNLVLIEGMSPVLLDGTGTTDSDEDLVVEWKQLSGTDIALEGAETFTPRLAVPQVNKDTEAVFELLVSDGHNVSKDTVTVTIRDFTLSAEVAGIKTLGFGWPAGLPVHHFRLLENPDGASGFASVADDIPASGNALGHEIPVHLLDWGNAAYLLEACLDEGCAESLTSNPVNAANLVAREAIGYFKASNSDQGDMFGTSVDLSGDGNWLAVGSPNEDGYYGGIDGDESSNFTSDSGAVYLYQRNQDGWRKAAYVKPLVVGTLDRFGQSVSLNRNGTVLVVGAPSEDSSATGVGGNADNDFIGNSGAAYVFRREGESWTQEAFLKATNTGINDVFGSVVSVNANGDVIAIGAPSEDSNSQLIDSFGSDPAANFDAGAVYVFRRDIDENWQVDSYLKPLNAGGGDQFGFSIAISDDGKRLVAAAPYEDSNESGTSGTGNNNLMDASGAAYVFDYDSTPGAEGWKQSGYFKASNPSIYAYFGIGLAISGDGNTIAAGAIWEDSQATGVNGDQSGSGANNSGAAYVFRYSEGSGWSQEAYVKPSNTQQGMSFGRRAALNQDGSVLAVSGEGDKSAATGIDGDESNRDLTQAGAVYMFTRDEVAGWNPGRYVKASNTGDWDQFSCSAITMSSDGALLAVSAHTEDSASVGINGDQDNDDFVNSGAVYIY